MKITAWFKQMTAVALIGVCIVGLPGRLMAQAATPQAAENCFSGLEYHDDGLGDEAQIAHDTQTLKTDPKNIDALLDRAKTYRSIGKDDLAVADYTQILSIDPHYTANQFVCNLAVTYMLQGEDALDAGQYPDALDAFQQALKADPTLPTYAPIYDDRGTVYLDEGQYDQALADFSQSIETLPNYPYGYIDRARLYASSGQIHPAEYDLLAAVGLDSQNVEAYTLLSDLYSDDNEPEEALKDANQVVTLAPNDASSYINRAIIYRAQGNDPAALTDLSQAITLDSTNAQAYLTRSYVYAHETKWDLALTDLNTALQYDPANPVIFETRSEVYRAQGNDPAALTDINQVIQLSPSNPDGYLHQGYIYADMGNDTGAMADYNKAIQVAPSYAWGYLARGASYAKLGQQDKAAADYFQYVEDLSTNVMDTSELLRDDSVDLEMSTGQIYLVPFNGEEGDKVTIAATSEDSVDSLLVLTDAQQNPLVADDDSGGNANALISGYRLPKTGMYWIVVTHAGGNSVGNIHVALTVRD